MGTQDIKGPNLGTASAFMAPKMMGNKLLILSCLKCSSTTYLSLVK